MKVFLFEDEKVMQKRFDRRCLHCDGFIGYTKSSKTKYCSARCVKIANQRKHHEKDPARI